MNLKKLFEMQKQLDDRIVKEHGLEGQNLLPKKILALQVELGECANEWRGFKMWSMDQEPRREKMLVEYVDCLHFILSIGLENELYREFDLECVPWTRGETVTDSFLLVFYQISQFDYDHDAWEYYCLFDDFLGLGEHLGFTWDQIEEAYISKNQTNHQRQDTGY